MGGLGELSITASTQIVVAIQVAETRLPQFLSD
jgi:hypothetical protein